MVDTVVLYRTRKKRRRPFYRWARAGQAVRESTTMTWSQHWCGTTATCAPGTAATPVAGGGKVGALGHGAATRGARVVGEEGGAAQVGVGPRRGDRRT
jgi:hypothetical protein